MKQQSLIQAFVTVFLSTTAVASPDWSKPVPVYDDETLCMTYRAAWTGTHLVVEAKIEPNWHTFAMDNRARQQVKLAGRPSLGIEKPTSIAVTGALELAGPWKQSEPKDFSKPDLLWFTWGFEEKVTFAVPVRKNGSGPAEVTVRGQACSGSICRNIEAVMQVGPDPVPAASAGLDRLIALQ
jgi:hypothetical protein